MSPAWQTDSSPSEPQGSPYLVLPEHGAACLATCGDLNGKGIKKEAMCEYVWLIHSALQQRLTQQYEAALLQYVFFKCGTYMQWNMTQL